MRSRCKVEDIADCYFYHTMELPGHGVIEGRDWDLRGGVDEYLGKVDFAGQRVLEIGPASGFLTFEMEKRGAEVVSVEVTDEHGWDFVPYPAEKIGRSVRSASNRDATAEEFLLVQSRRSSIQSESVLRRCLQFACRARTIRHRSNGLGAVTLPRPAPNRRAMRKNRRDRSSLSTCSTRIWKERQFAVSRRLRRIFCGIPGGISAHNFSPSF